MLAYKFRSSSQIIFALDVIFNKRLYCSDWATLNDPMEGMFAYSYSSTAQADVAEEVADIVRENKRLRVCSLSTTFDCHLLWAHYASGFDGLAIEVELPDYSKKIKRVQYGGVFAFISIDDNKPTGEIANSILTSKYQEWAYEKEVRILNHDEWYQLRTPVKRIIAGHRMNPSLFQALRIICDRQKITLNRTGIGDEGIDADFVTPLDE